MKKLLMLVTISLFYLIGKTQTQHPQTPHVEFGVKAGLNVAGLHSSAANNLDSRASVYAGGLAHIHLSKHIAIQPEVVYSGQGAKQNVGDGNYVLRLNYINVPVLLQYMIADGFRLQTGPQLGLLTNAKAKTGNITTGVKSDYTSADFAWSVGAGYLTHSGLGVDARYNIGINNINNTGNYSQNKLQNRVFQIGLFYQFMH
jgi:hypothetical protein